LEIPREQIRLTRQIGMDTGGASKGRWSKVFLADCFGMQVVVKVPTDVSPNKLSDFQNEVKLLSQIHHPNICMFLGASLKPPNHYWLVTERLREDLGDVINNPQRALSLYQRLRMARDICLGMIIVHENNIIHRDLKPANCLLDDQGVVKIADFGYSTLVQTIDPPKRQCGTLFFMAPEIMRGVAYDRKVDVYSYAMVLVMLISRRDPYPLTRWSSPQAFIKDITGGVRPELPAETPSKLVQLLRRCWHADPAQRPSFNEIANELTPILVETAIEDPIARIFWLKHLSNDLEPDWPTFLKLFGAAILLPFDPHVQDGSDVISHETLPLEPSGGQLAKASPGALSEWSRSRGSTPDVMNVVNQEMARRSLLQAQRCLEALIATAGSVTTPSVCIEEFGRVCSLFGPILVGSSNFLRNLVEVLRCNWFQGPISGADALRLLKDKPPNSFLVRFSGSTSGCTLSWVNQTQSGRKILHVRVKQSSAGFSLPTEDPSVYPSLPALINALVMQEKLRPTSLTNPYEHLFRETLADMGSYAHEFSDDWAVVGNSLSQSESPPGKRQRLTDGLDMASSR